MAQDTTALEPNRDRQSDRHNHIGIRLQLRANAEWMRLEALGWNTMGFNFYASQDIEDPVLQLKRGLTRFEGHIIWRSPITSDGILQSAILNELIYEKTKTILNNTALQMRLMKLIRVSGLVDEKRKILASLGTPVSETQISDRLAQRKREQAMFHYGVRVQSETWSAVVANAMELSDVVGSLNKWANALGKS